MDANITIGLDTPIAVLTPRQLFQMQNEWMDAQPKKADGQDDVPRQRNILYSMQQLADFLGVTYATVSRLKASGQLDDCISQGGRWMVIDGDAVLDKFRLSNRKKRKRGLSERKSN